LKKSNYNLLFDFPEATKASQEILSLPIFPELDEKQISYIAGEIKGFSLRNKV
jgi:dTDP-4-amino-4,6-dideoxygalactose transaminase